MAHSFAADIYVLVCKLRREKDPLKRSQLMVDIAHLKGGVDRPLGKLLIGRHTHLRNGSYKPRPKWLKDTLARIEARNRPLHLDAE